jgi:hypothetical protein
MQVILLLVSVRSIFLIYDSFHLISKPHHLNSKEKCWNGGKVGHFRRDYKEEKKNKTKEEEEKNDSNNESKISSQDESWWKCICCIFGNPCMSECVVDTL